jgi:hypothetical protein
VIPALDAATQVSTSRVLEVAEEPAAAVRVGETGAIASVYMERIEPERPRGRRSKEPPLEEAVCIRLTIAYTAN